MAERKARRAPRPTGVIARRELGEILRNRSTLVMAGAFAVGLPLMFFFITAHSVAQAPEAAHGAFYSAMLLQIALLPAAVVLTTAAGSFVGEIENGSILPLIATPVRDTDIYWAKMLANVVPAIVLGYLATAIFALAVLARSPGLAFDPFVLWTTAALVPVFYVLTLGLSLTVSAFAKEVRSAQQYSSFLLLPLLFGLIFGATELLEPGRRHWYLLVIAAMTLADLVIIRYGARLWRRDRIVTRI